MVERLVVEERGRWSEGKWWVAGKWRVERRRQWEVEVWSWQQQGPRRWLPRGTRLVEEGQHGEEGEARGTGMGRSCGGGGYGVGDERAWQRR